MCWVLIVSVLACRIGVWLVGEVALCLAVQMEICSELRWCRSPCLPPAEEKFSAIACSPAALGQKSLVEKWEDGCRAAPKPFRTPLCCQVSFSPFTCVSAHVYIRASLCSCLFLLRVSLLLVGVREEPAREHRQQVVKKEAHTARVLSSDTFLGDLEQSSKLTCAGVNDIITCISICYADYAEEVRWIQCCSKRGIFAAACLCGAWRQALRPREHGLAPFRAELLSVVKGEGWFFTAKCWHEARRKELKLGVGKESGWGVGARWNAGFYHLAWSGWCCCQSPLCAAWEQAPGPSFHLLPNELRQGITIKGGGGARSEETISFVYVVAERVAVDKSTEIML